MILRLFTFLTGIVGPGLIGSLAAQTLTNNGAYLLVQSGAVLTVQGSVANSAGSTLANAGIVQLTGNFSNAGAVVSTGALVFSGVADQTLVPGGAALGQVEVNNTGAAGQNRLLLPANTTITQRLTLTQGLVRTGPTNFLTLPVDAVVQGEGTGRYIQGNLRVVRDNVAGPVDFGNGVVLDATGTPLGTVTVTRTAGLATAGVSYSASPNTPAKGIDRIWAIASTQAPSKAVPLTFAWTPDDDNGLASFSQAQVWQQQGTTSSWVTAAPPTDASMRSITTTATTFSRWTVSNAANPLPVELTAFTAERQLGDAWLRWTTAQEPANNYFAVESSADGLQFRRIATVAGQGTGTQGAAYELKDPNIARYGALTIYYRLRQVDQDGSETFSPVRSVSAPLVAALTIQAYPNPFGGALAVRIEAASAGAATLALHDALGRTVWQQALVLAPGATAYSVPAAGALPPGVYLLTVSQGARQQHLTLTRE